MPVKGRKAYGTKRQEMAKNADRLGKMKSCHYSKHEVERLIELFKTFTKGLPANKRGNKGLDRSKFRDILHQHFGMTEDMLNDKVFKAFDSDNDGVIAEEEWVLGMSTFLRGTIEEQAEFCFQVYSTRKDDNHISRDEMLMLLKNSVVHQSHEEDADDMPKDLVELALKKMDIDHDGKLSLDDYKKAVQQEKLLLEALGPCLPNKTYRDAFLEMIADEQPKTRLCGK